MLHILHKYEGGFGGAGSVWGLSVINGGVKRGRKKSRRLMHLPAQFTCNVCLLGLVEGLLVYTITSKLTYAFGAG